MKLVPTKARGLSLLEVVVSLGVLAFVVGSVLLVYSGILASAKKVDSNQEAVTALATLVDVWKLRLKEQWPDTPPTTDTTQSYVNETFRGYSYDVVDYGRMPSPAVASFDANDPTHFIQMKRVELKLRYDDNSSGKTIERELSTVFYVAN